MKRLPGFLSLAAAVVGACAVVKMWPSQHPADQAVVSSEAVYQATSCRLNPGEVAAFRLRSTVTAEGQSDRFEAIMSWEVVALNSGVARVRAVFSDVTLTQELSLPQERAASPQGQPFFLEIASNCAVTAKAYAPEWDAKTRLLVSTQLDNYAFALPGTGDSAWKAEAEDGMGKYTAAFTREGQSPLVISRQKTSHMSQDSAAAFGIEISLANANAHASFNESLPMWWQSIKGQEQLTVRAPGHPDVTMSQHYSLSRDDSKWVSVPMLQWQHADLTQPEYGPAEFALLKNTHHSYTEARTAFATAINATPPRYFDAALELAAWLQENPGDVATLVAELRGDLDSESRPTAFHALQLSGTDEARSALSELINDYALSAVDQARAASALADLGEPSQEVADLLLARADIDDTAGKVSILSVGSMTSRAEDSALREHLLTSLNDRHAAASDNGGRLLLLDAMGNSGDAHFLEVLSDELASDSSAIRRHAAAALSKLPAEEAKPALLARLSQEQDSRVSTSLIKALEQTGAAIPELTGALDQQLVRANDNQRAAIVDLLGAQGSDDAQQLLVKQFKRESNVHIKQRIGRYLPAEALR